MSDKKLNHAQNSRGGKEPLNTYLNSVVKSRGLKAVEALGFAISEFVEKCLEKAHEAHMQRPRRKPGEPLQFEFFDRLRDEEPGRKRKKGGSR